MVKSLLKLKDMDWAAHGIDIVEVLDSLYLYYQNEPVIQKQLIKYFSRLNDKNWDLNADNVGNMVNALIHHKSNMISSFAAD